MEKLKIYIQQFLFPDIVILVKDEKNGNNIFTLKLNSSLAHASFKGINLKMIKH